MFSLSTTRLCMIATLTLILTMSLVAYLWFHIETKGEELKTNMQTVKDRAALEHDYLSQQGVLEETQEERTQLARYVLDGEDGAVSFLSLVDALAAELNINLETTELKVSEGEHEVFETLRVSLVMEGDERSVMKMLQLFETMPYKGKVVSLNTTRNRSEATGITVMRGTVTLNLSIVKE